MMAVEPGSVGPAWQEYGQRLRRQTPELKGVVVMSAHWMAHQPEVQSHPAPATWHDFGGFPPALYRLQYPAPGSPELARQVQDLLQQTGWPTQADPRRPFDHGAWVPLRWLLPKADVPVVQLALPLAAKPADVYALGLALRSLRERGMLLMGSGSMTHNLHDYIQHQPALQATPVPYVQTFSRWVEDRILAQDREALLEYRTQAPHAVRAHPSDEHFLPLYFALGAAGWATEDSPAVTYLTREVQYGYLAMDSLTLQ